MTHRIHSLPVAWLVAVAVVFSAATCGPASGPRRDFADAGAGKLDPNRDNDGDGLSGAQGDCDDADNTVFPGADEICDHKDNNCNHEVDEVCDGDGDGYTQKDGDCNDADRLVNPGAAEVKGDKVDNNCNGQTDEDAPPCDNVYKKTEPRALAAAIGLCAPWVVDAKVISPDPKTHDVRTKYGGTYKPKQGPTLTMLSTGLAVDKSDPGFVPPQDGTDFNGKFKNPLPMNQNNNVCGKNSTDPLDVYDYVELNLKLKVPSNANSFTFQFMFVSSEYPEFVGSEYNDKFLAVLDSQSYKGNISFDSRKNPITVNVGFFDVCDKKQRICGDSKPGSCTRPITELNGTGYEDVSFDGTIGGGTGWLTTTSPVTPGETLTLRFILFDEGDGIYDSSVIIDNFQWAVEGSVEPMTIP